MDEVSFIRTSDGDVEGTACELSADVDRFVLDKLRTFAERSIDTRRSTVHRYRLIDAPTISTTHEHRLSARQS